MRSVRAPTAVAGAARSAVVLVCLVLALAEALAAQTVSGHAFVTFGDGRSELVRGETVSLVCASGNVEPVLADRLAALEQVGTGLWETLNPEADPTDPMRQLARTSGAAYFAKTYLPRLIGTYYAQFAPVVLQSVRTDFQGAYRFDAVAPGRYLIVAAYHTTTADAVWQAPVEVGADAVSLDLSTANLVDLQRAVRYPEVLRKLAWVDDMVAQYARSSAAQLAFANGQLDAVRAGASRELPATAVTPALSCH